MHYRIDGIYDKKTLTHFQNWGVNSYSFDFRPRSFNFIQQYVFNNIVKTSIRNRDNVFLHFCNEKDYIIEKIVKDTPLVKGKYSQLSLEFSDSLDVSFYEKFQVPFLWHYRSGRDLNEFLKSPFFIGLIIDINIITNIYETGQLREFSLDLGSEISLNQKNGVYLILKQEWTSQILPSYLELFDFEFFSLPINSMIETGYRQVDVAKSKDYFFKIQSLMALAH